MKGDLTQLLMDEVYDKWNSPEALQMGRLDVIDNFFTEKHKAAIQLGNMNYQVNNGGWSQWHSNGYSEDMDDLIEIFKKGSALGINHFNTLLNILENIRALGEPKDYSYTDENEEECCECGGSGEIEVECGCCDDENEECPECGGDRYTNQECPACNGKGSIFEEYEVNGEEEYGKKLEQFDDEFYKISEDELLSSYDEYLERICETVDTSNIKANIIIKPRCKLIGEDGNVFNIIGRVEKALKNAGLKDKAEEFKQKAFSAENYNQVLCLAMEYADVY